MTPEELSRYSIKVSNYKSFGPDPQGFDQLRPFNLLVGPNNAGKSTLLDVVDFVTTQGMQGLSGNSAVRLPEQSTAVLGYTLWSLTSADEHTGPTPPQFEPKPLEEAPKRIHTQLQAATEDQSEMPAATSRWALQFRYCNNEVAVGIEVSVADSTSRFDVPENELAVHTPRAQLASFILRLAPGRNLKRALNQVPDANVLDADLGAEGERYTEFLRAFQLDGTLPNGLLRTKLLEGLNEILGPDESFEEIGVFRRAPTVVAPTSDCWEIRLRRRDGSAIWIGDMGHGIKTVVIVLCMMHLRTALPGRETATSVLLLEELENNLHPTTYRRLIAYLLEKSRDPRFLFFVTSHSPVAIDLVLNDEYGQVVHVQQEPHPPNPSLRYTRCRAVLGTDEAYQALETLGVRAGDILQANGVIWIEGPSDRIYLKHWIELASGDELKENVHYSFAIYGGSVLSHIVLSSDERDDLLKLLPLNRNGAVVFDSDRKFVGDGLNAAKQRLLNEAKDQLAPWMMWVTGGREIENYLPPSALTAISGLAYTSEFQEIPDALRQTGGNSGKRKVVLAGDLTTKGGINRANMYECDQLFGLDLREKLHELCSCIRRWNGIK